MGAGVQVKAGRVCLPPRLQVKPGILRMGPGLGCADGCSLPPRPRSLRTQAGQRRALRFGRP